MVVGDVGVVLILNAEQREQRARALEAARQAEAREAEAASAAEEARARAAERVGALTSKQLKLSALAAAQARSASMLRDDDEGCWLREVQPLGMPFEVSAAQARDLRLLFRETFSEMHARAPAEPSSAAGNVMFDDEDEYDEGSYSDEYGEDEYDEDGEDGWDEDEWDEEDFED